ncbi:lipoyl domain-containing protein [Streptomyces sp. ACA25]|uniref:lipoyl domain-containing protein n=1 Tax=Streptomyces sp. ACA25 TaxID=3022596 RepID=UPI00230741F1|nr:lipoyl domain-containing protein [Streptomyces sp. ACA25]MDB1087000.1 lipoyl domain-containing protein [Streptomyces sp. ACA25]
MSDSSLDMHVPSFGHGLGEALLVEWIAAVGDRVERGDVIAVVETDKASTEIVAERSGQVTAHSTSTGTIIESGQVLYRLAADQPSPRPETPESSHLNGEGT